MQKGLEAEGQGKGLLSAGLSIASGTRASTAPTRDEDQPTWLRILSMAAKGRGGIV